MPKLGTRAEQLGRRAVSRRQEVARAFFAAGGAAGTLAKSISAYDMAVSDSLYGAAKRYVSRERLEAMLALEFSQLVRQLGDKRGESKCFFAFANSVATRHFGSAESGRGWLGVRFQAHPREEPSEVVIHAHLLDREVAHEQEVLETGTVHLQHRSIHAADCAECETRAGMIDHIEVELVLTGPLTDLQRAKLVEIAEKCPVHRTLTSEIDIRTRLRV